MKTIIYIICILILLAFIADLTIQFKPFKIELPGLKLALAAVFIWLGLLLFASYHKSEGYKRGKKN